MRLLTRILLSLRMTAARTARPPRSGAGALGPRKRLRRSVGQSPTLDRHAAPYENSALVAHDGGAHSAPAKERRGGIGAPQATAPKCGAELHVGPSCGSLREFCSRCA